MAQGTIKRLVRDRGFGFIQADDGREIFFHRSGFPGSEFDTLREGQRVEFDVERGEKGLRANRLKLVP
ncbi:MAG: cold shock domain-containing protein [Deltaproteobacteria bacterium]|nr:cold shock domain-containing protein [Deltaproteobacteria bacterium]